MKTVLIIGGTRFVGRHLVNALLETKHQLTLFNRGKTNPQLFTQIEMITGDREFDLDRLDGRHWDIVIDTCGYFPRIVNLAVEKLSKVTDHYIFISSISVYANHNLKGMVESSPVDVMEDNSIEEITPETYGGLKVLCEKVVRAAFKHNHTIIRPGLIVGPHDPTDRFTYWVRRFRNGGNILAPGSPKTPIQFIDARDLADWIIKIIDNPILGTYNAVGPKDTLTFADLFETLQDLFSTQVEYSWLSEQFLLDQKVSPFTDLPLWLPKESIGMMMIDNKKAIHNGLSFRHLSEICDHVSEWDMTRPQQDELINGLQLKRELELIELWQQKSKSK